MVFGSRIIEIVVIKSTGRMNFINEFQFDYNYKFLLTNKWNYMDTFSLIKVQNRRLVVIDCLNIKYGR